MDLNYTFPLQPAEQALQTGQYDFVISYNYIPLLSDLCENYKTIYIDPDDEFLKELTQKL